MKKIAKKYKLGNPTTKLEIWLDGQLELSSRASTAKSMEILNLKRAVETASGTAEEQLFNDRFREAMALFLHDASQKARLNAEESLKTFSALGLKNPSNAAVWQKVSRECFRLATQYAAKG